MSVSILQLIKQAKTPAEFVERSIAENRAIVFSKSYCGFRCAKYSLTKGVLWLERVQRVRAIILS